LKKFEVVFKKYGFLIICILLVLVSVIILECLKPSITSEIILLITALIILWYTFETYLIRKKEEFLLTREKKPLVGFSLNLNLDNVSDIQFHISNLSKYPVACLVKLSIKIDENIINIKWPEYDGDKYWNIQVRQTMHGHFRWVELFKGTKIITDEKIQLHENIPKPPGKYTREQFLKYSGNDSVKIQSTVNIDVDVFSMNEFKEHLSYPQVHYSFDLTQCKLITELCSGHPYFDYDDIPDWLDNKVNNYL